jgi:hypothetical protein
MECDPPACESEHQAHACGYLVVGVLLCILLLLFLLLCGKRKLHAAAAMEDSSHTCNCAVLHHRAFISIRYSS